jgi:predicted transcriptional regulator
MAQRRLTVLRTKRNQTAERPRSTAHALATSTAKMADGRRACAQTQHRWTFLSNHGHVLLLLGREQMVVLREVAERVGITERAVQRIIADLEQGGFLHREKVGRQNRYSIRPDRPLRHSIEAHRTIGDLMKILD